MGLAYLVLSWLALQIADVLVDTMELPSVWSRAVLGLLIVGFIPTLVLGIPGTPPDAVILGALLIQGVRTGPNLFTTEGSIVFTFIYGLFLATILMLPIGLVIGRYAYKTIITVPKAMLVPTVAFMTMIGTYAIRNSISDVVIMIVLGLILGSIAEQGFVQAWTIGAATDDLVNMFFGRPISLAIIAMILLSLFYPLIRSRWLGGSRRKVRAD